jgi:hypothetical protein
MPREPRTWKNLGTVELEPERRNPDLENLGTSEPRNLGTPEPPEPQAPYLNMFFATNQRLAGRSARRRMYHGNQYSP